MEAGILLTEIKAHGLDIQAIDGALHVRPRHLITETMLLILLQLVHIFTHCSRSIFCGMQSSPALNKEKENQCYV